MADELAAMANTVTGNFILGIDDKTKEITGIPEDKQIADAYKFIKSNTKIRAFKKSGKS